MMRLLFICILSINLLCFAQGTDQELPYREIPNPPETYTSGATVARMIDGLGFRFYWATDSLTFNDLKYKPSEEARTTLQTIQHIHDLSQMILNAALKQQNETGNTSELSYSELRQVTLNNLKTAADIFRSATDLTDYDLKFGKRELPFWLAINGPISDAIWHCGQISSFRRSSGNPINEDIIFFSGTVKD